MKERLEQYRGKIIEFWNARTTKQKGLFITSFILFLIVVIGGSLLANRSTMVPLYSDLTMQEAGQIKAELDERGVKNEVTDSGTSIRVPSEQADALLVDLAAQGIPNSGSIDYSFFSENTSWGITDNEFDMIKLDAMQTELGNLLTGFAGIDQANVMINLPDQQIFVSDAQQEATASIRLTLVPGYTFEQDQVNALYHLISKSVPNLPTSNIVIMDQNFSYYDLNDEDIFSSANVYANQQAIKKDIERDIQRRVQQLLGTMIGNDKVIATVTTDIDFTQENRVEQLVEPVDEEEIEGLPISVETIHETYSGDQALADIAGAGEEDITNYPAGETGQGNYELIQESVNYEFNRIQREISESPYKIRDLGIQVAIDNRTGVLNAQGQPEYLTAAEQANVEQSIASILESIISTSIDGSYGEVDFAQNTSIVFQEFNNDPVANPAVFTIAVWMYIALGIALLLIIILIILLMRKRRGSDQSEFEAYEEVSATDSASVAETDFDDISGIEEAEDTEGTIRRKQLEKMAKDKPDEFAKLLRSWISED
ncbi:flagellar M-ring protein FliF [Amphibacillus marinus]|uniref:Flagellar M-ring protein n=1 Tax=Amphibacillus marinus TaxID=872970 RepID=A0A1H8HSP3_9BACI|nr:flagellar basal-body MS-ring/collar protein FliF [Amphibacillus marinus]SEN59139.1 flagellar M-ring protein FliF [Amphibacillus marinus]